MAERPLDDETAFTPLDRGLAAAFGPGTSARPGVLEELTGSFGPVPRVLLRDTDGGDESPIVRPSSDEVPARPDAAGRLQLFGEIARGGMGAVLKGRDPDLGRELAVKVLLEKHRDSPEMVRRFVEEAQIGGQLQHPGIVPVYELGAFADRRPYFAMRLVKGRTLASLLADRRDPSHDLPRFLTIFEAICQTTAYAHARGVIHRDLKPSNVMVGNFGEVQVMDWGLAKVLPRGGASDDASAGRAEVRETVIATARSGSDTDHSRAGSVLGTPSYMAPEQARGEVDRLDERSDVFALGSILCEMLTGAPAFAGRSSAEIQRKSSLGDTREAADRLRRSGTDPDLIDLALSCLAPEADDRPRDASAVADRTAAYREGVEARLRRAEIAGAEEKARAVEASKRARVERDRFRLTVALAASVLGLIVLGLGGWAYLAQARAWRRAATERVVTQSLDEAYLLRGQAEAAPLHDLSKWSEALASARQARSLMATGEPDPSLHVRVDTLLALLEREQADAAHRAVEAERDRDFLERLEGISLDRANPQDWGTTDAAFATAFRDFGVDPDQMDPQEAGRRLLKRSESMEIAVFLDDWAMGRRGNPMSRNVDSWGRLFATAQAIDPDKWRGALRAMIRETDYTGLARVAADKAGLAQQPVQSLRLLAKSLVWREDYEEAQKVLKLAWQLRPGDYWVCSELGRLKGEESVRFATAAVAMRPRSFQAHRTLAHALGRARGFHSFGVTLTSEGYRIGSPSETVMRPAPRELDETLAEFRTAIRLRPQEPDLHFELAHALRDKEGSQNEIISEFRTATTLATQEGTKSHLFEYHLFAAVDLSAIGRLDEAVSEAREAVRVNPQVDLAHCALASILQKQGKYDEAFAEYREAYLPLKDMRMPGLLQFLHATGKPGEDLDVVRERRRHHPDKSDEFSDLIGAYGFCGMLEEVTALCGYLHDFGELSSATTQIDNVSQAHPDNAQILGKLGLAYLERGELTRALDKLNDANRLLKDRPDPEVLSHLRDAKRLAGLESRLDGILRGEGVPSDPGGKFDVADLCRFKGHFKAAAHFYREAFQAKPAIADDVVSQQRSHAAIAAARAGTDPSPPKGDPPIDEAERARWRKQSLDWLRGEYSVCTKLLATGQLPQRVLSRKTLSILAHHRDLACVRDADALAKLPEPERKGWQSLWADVDALLARANEVPAK